jgi:polar amino acid transport system substrate-binding protein
MKLRWAFAAAACAATVPLAATARGTVGSPLPVAARPLPPLTQTPPAAPTPPPKADCGDPTRSLRPPATMPRPGAMPAGSFLRTIEQRGFLRAGVLTDVPPFGSIDSAGQFAGFDVDIAEAIGLAIFGAPGHVRYRSLTNAERIPVLRAGQVDVVVATMTVNCDRRTKIDFSSVYYDATQRVLVVRGSPYHSIADLGGKRVCAATGTTSIQHIAQAASHPVPYPVTNVADCLVALEQGTVAAISTDDTILVGMRQQDPQTVIVGPGLDPEPDAVGVSLQHPDLTRFVNGVLAEIKSDGRWEAIYRDRVGSALGPAPAPPPNRYRD